MEFSTGITQFNTDYNLNSISNYNKYLQENSKFMIDDSSPTAFESTLEAASKSYPLRDKNTPAGMGQFVAGIGDSFGNALNSVNNARLEANRMQEDIALGGPTNIHDAMIAAEKASLSMQMAIQVRNRILSAYTEIASMGL